MKELKWKHDKDCCTLPHQCCGSDDEKGLEVLTPYPKKRNGFERRLNRYNHIMEFARTMLAITTVGLQLIILYRLTN